MPRHLRRVSLAHPLAVFQQPLADSRLPGRRPLSHQQIAHKAEIFLPRQNDVSDQPPGHQRRDVSQSRRQMDEPSTAAHALRNQSHQFFEGKCLRPNCVDHGFAWPLHRVHHQLRHVPHVDRTNSITPVPRNPKDRKMPHEPRNIVDENIFRAENYSRPQNRVRQPRLDHRLLHLRFPSVVAQRRLCRRIRNAHLHNPFDPRVVGRRDECARVPNCALVVRRSTRKPHPIRIDEGRRALHAAPQFVGPVEVVRKDPNMFAKRILPLSTPRRIMIRQRPNVVPAAQQNSRRVFPRVAERPGDDDRRAHYSPPSRDIRSFCRNRTSGAKKGALTPPSSSSSFPSATTFAPSPWVAASSDRAIPSPPRRIPPSPPVVHACSPPPVRADSNPPGTAAASPASDRSLAASSAQSPAGTSPTHLSSIHNARAGRPAREPPAQSPTSPARESTCSRSIAPRSTSPQFPRPAAPSETNTAARESALRSD